MTLSIWQTLFLGNKFLKVPCFSHLLFDIHHCISNSSCVLLYFRFQQDGKQSNKLFKILREGYTYIKLKFCRATSNSISKLKYWNTQMKLNEICCLHANSMLFNGRTECTGISSIWSQIFTGNTISQLTTHTKSLSYHKTARFPKQVQVALEMKKLSQEQLSKTVFLHVLEK